MTFLLTLLSFVGIVFLMAIGVIFSRKPIKGSCGGLAQLDIERECNCKDVCEEHSRTLYQITEPSS
ncbi:(Na+)-NQR maturation NqrM [Vibrio lentus]|uniref:(Na+)-NQR maturation NqrM n=1 Tax=Vibrio lentus TaxID=136468 RepID=UPI002479BFB4|nr:(Na+)-NQR maturation NqrM [Vibrio lentus]WGS60337.1 (Na+)-NQR maturation NqrM [Vibrio lentus]